MTFILKNTIVCAGKYVVNDEKDDVCSINLLSSSDNMQTPICDNAGNDILFKIGAMKLIETAIRHHWTYVDLKEFQL